MDGAGRVARERQPGRHEGPGDAEAERKRLRPVFEPQVAQAVADPLLQGRHERGGVEPGQALGFGPALRPHDRGAVPRAVVVPHGQQRQRSAGQEMLHRPAPVVAAVRQRGYHGGLVVVAGHDPDAGRLAQPRSSTVRHDQQAAREPRGPGAGDVQRVGRPREAPHGPGPRRHARGRAGGSQGIAQVVVAHHVGHRLARRDLAREAEEHGRGKRAGRRVREVHGGDGLRAGRHRVPDPEGREEPPRTRRHRDGAQGAVGPTREARVAQGHAAPLPPHRERGREPHDAGTGDHEVEGGWSRGVVHAGVLPGVRTL